MGPQISYPLNYDTIKELENVFSIFNENKFIGMIQKVRIDKDNIHIGRFVLNPRKTGLGLKTLTLWMQSSLVVASTALRSRYTLPRLVDYAGWSSWSGNRNCWSVPRITTRHAYIMGTTIPEALRRPFVAESIYLVLCKIGRKPLSAILWNSTPLQDATLK